MKIVFEEWVAAEQRVVAYVSEFPRVRWDGIDYQSLCDDVRKLGVGPTGCRVEFGPSDAVIGLEYAGSTLPVCANCDGSGREVLFQTANDCPHCGGFGCLTMNGARIDFI